MASITNNSSGPRTINTEDGPVTLAAGESRDDLKISKAEKAAMDKHGLLDAAGVSGGNTSIADLQREIASAAGSTAADPDELGGDAKAEMQAVKDAEAQAAADAKAAGGNS